MLPRRDPASTLSPPRWQADLSRAIRSPRELLERLQLPVESTHIPDSVLDEFPLLVPESYVQRMQPGNLTDPLLQQVLPLSLEEVPGDGFLEDPVGDHAARIAPGLLHKYHGRALLIAHGSCAVHCRYCFRRHFPYESEPKSLEAWGPALQAIREDSSLREIILSGGDPLILSDRRLQLLIEQLEEIPHLRRLRIHSRLPIVLPSRVTPQLVSVLKSTRLRVVIVVHSNHANELTGDCAEAIDSLVSSGFMVLNQAVLLNGVNDTLDALRDLCERCIDLGVQPYYLHQLDRVRGASHFEVPVEKGLELIRQLRQLLPGYAVPTYVREQAGEASKTPLV